MKRRDPQIRLKELPAFAREGVSAYLDAWDRYLESPSAVPPPKQIQVPVPGIPDLYLLGYRTGALAWRSDYRNPLTGKWTCVVLGRFGATTMSAAIAAHLQLQADVTEGRSPRSRQMKFDAAVEQVFTAAIARGKRSLRDDVSRYRNHLKGRLGDLSLGQLNRGVLERIARDLRVSLTPATADRCVALLRAICRDLVDLNLLTTNPASSLRIANVVRARTTLASPDQLARLGAAMAAMPPSQTIDFVQFLMVTGLRSGEARRAKFSDVDEARGVLSLPVTKSGVPQSIPLSPEAMRIVDRRKAYRHSSDFLFPSRDGLRPMSHPHRAFQALQKHAGISGLSLHDLRRGFATAGIQAQGVSVLDVSRLLRHSRTSVTETHYLIADNDRLRQAANQASRTIYAGLGLDGARNGSPELHISSPQSQPSTRPGNGGDLREIFDELPREAA
ncbi:tyrosine-type recombinase/integrase [Aromatoleum evansii]|uniref:tyrosine-type recombinase/integrase n=1 Tax=Aromatoleum evansii TaxID=59406 RepID=UPI00145FAC2C|nr:tyrosine-type recombinase/integrase [Aromatoleum evansii]NMG31100.1 tyrosine-type recombinase/integrase [Aromatoleum evansii]